MIALLSDLTPKHFFSDNIPYYRVRWPYKEFLPVPSEPQESKNLKFQFGQKPPKIIQSGQRRASSNQERAGQALVHLLLACCVSPHCRACACAYPVRVDHFPPKIALLGEKIQSAPRHLGNAQNITKRFKLTGKPDIIHPDPFPSWYYKKWRL